MAVIVTSTGGVKKPIAKPVEKPEKTQKKGR